MFVVVFSAVGAVILVIHLCLAAGVIRNMVLDARGDGAAGKAGVSAGVNAGPLVEVVVAVRDEAPTLPALLESLSAQTDGGCLFLFVEDRSGDGTAEMLDRFCASTGPRARVLHLTEQPEGLTGTQAALDAAFTECRGEVLLFTDGDCTCRPGWVSGFKRYFSDPRVGVVLGRVEVGAGGSFLSRFQAFEQPLINQYNLGAAGIGAPMGCFGNNMAVRADAIRGVGGFSRIGYAVTEDAALLSAVSALGTWKIRAATRAETTVRTAPKPAWRDYANQHARWNAGAFFSKDLRTRLGYSFIVFYLMACILALPFGFLDPRITLLGLNAFLCIGILGLLGGFYEGTGSRYFAILLPYLFVFGFFYSWVSLRALVRRPFEWKGAVLGPKRPGGG